MISYWVTEDGKFGAEAYRENRGRAIADRFQARLYDHIGRQVRVSAGAQIFSALDRLTDSQKKVVAAIWDAHARACPRALRLNDPRRVLFRFPLLTSLHEQGVNAYRVFRATDLSHVDRFPVFVRHMHDHSGPRTSLLNSRREVVEALRALRLRGDRLQDLIIVEFCNTSDPSGLFRKFSAFKVGETIIAWHLMVSRHWCVKSGRNELNDERVREGLRYVEDNPHDRWLRRVFAIAGVDYGRVDYGMLDGVPQVWEINLNPTLGRPAGWRKRPLPPHVNDVHERNRATLHGRLREAFLALDVGGREREISVDIDNSLVLGAMTEVAASRRRSRLLNGLASLRDHPQLGVPARAILRLFPRP